MGGRATEAPRADVAPEPLPSERARGKSADLPTHVTPVRLLLLGSLPPPAGGTTIALEQLVDALADEESLETRVVDLARRGPLDPILIPARIARAVLYSDVIALNASPPGIDRLAPILIASRKPVVLRVFGGNLDLHLDSAAPSRKARLVRALESATVVFVETDHLAAKLGDLAPRARIALLRNSRPLPPRTPLPPRPGDRLVFVGDISAEKGAVDLCQAMKIASRSGVRLDFFGTCRTDEVAAALRATPGVRACGPVEPEDVARELANCSALVLPTRHVGEGHPGVVIEAFMAGRAVIATRHRALPEIVENDSTGLLIPVGDVPLLAEALIRVASEPGLAARLGAGAWREAQKFSSAHWARVFADACRRAAQR